MYVKYDEGVIILLLRSQSYIRHNDACSGKGETKLQRSCIFEAKV